MENLSTSHRQVETENLEASRVLEIPDIFPDEPELTDDELLELDPDDCVALTEADLEALQDATPEEVHILLAQMQADNVELTREAVESAKADIRKSREVMPHE